MAARCLQHEVDHLERHRLRRPAARGRSGSGCSPRRPDPAATCPHEQAGPVRPRRHPRRLRARASRPRSGSPSPSSGCRSRRPRSCGRWSGRRCRTASRSSSGCRSPTSTARGRRLPGALHGRRAARRPRLRRASRSCWRALRADGAILAVATSKPEPFAVRILTHVGLLGQFASVHGATLDGAVRHKDQVVAAALAAPPGRPGPGARRRPGAGRPRRRGARAAVHRCRLGAGRGRRAGGGGRGGGRGHPGGRRRGADVWTRWVAGHLTVHDRIDAAARPRPRLQPQGLAGAVQQ